MNVLHYKIYAQDGAFVELTCPDTPSMRKFTEWVRIHDRYTSSVPTANNGCPTSLAAREADESAALFIGDA